MSAAKIPYKILSQWSPIQFVVGPERKEFFIHPILTDQYNFPRPMAKATYSECHKSSGIILLSTAEDTFARFVEYMYTGDYPAADPWNINEMVSTTDDESTLNGIKTPSQSTSSETERHKDNSSEKPRAPPRLWLPWLTRSQRMWHDFRTRNFDTATLEGRPVARPNKDKTEDFSPVLLSHAELHTFALQYDIEHLQALALYKLHEPLVKFTLHDERCGDIAALVKYTYQRRHESVTQADGLRALVHEYLCCKVEKLIPNEEFKSMLRREDPKLLDILERLLRRLD